jgi:hypothetical protein
MAHRAATPVNQHERDSIELVRLEAGLDEFVK